ncbi:unnamed protein product, partial [Staurois parvus]
HQGTDHQCSDDQCSPISAAISAHQCWLLVQFSTSYQCPSVPPTNAYQCHLEGEKSLIYKTL